MNFEIKAMKRDKEGPYIMIKVSIQEEDITIINIYAPNRSTAICKTTAAKLLLSHFSRVRLCVTP